MNNLISFSLWGSSPKYCVGAIKNADLALKVYSGYKCRFYVDALVPFGTINELEIRDNVEVVFMNEVGDYSNALFWRFNAINDAPVVLIRDTDSRLSLREKACVDEFIASDKLYNTIRDHPAHQFCMMPGLSAFKKSSADFKIAIRTFMLNFPVQQYGYDYTFFKVNFHLLERDLMVHDDFLSGHKIKVPRKGLDFIGQVFDENDVPNKQHEQALAQYLGGL